MKTDKNGYGRGRTMTCPAQFARFTEHRGIKIGDRVRVVEPHYEAGSYTEGTVRWIWAGPQYEKHGDGGGFNVRFYAEHVADRKRHPHYEGEPKWDEGGFAAEDLEVLS